MEQFDRLYDIIRTLRSENGCPWDREQTVKSMANHLLEETYEVIDGIDTESDEDLQEEIGDLMFLTVFISYVAEQEGKFSVESAIKEVADKLVRRHPHVFDNADVDGTEDVLRNWEKIKLTEKKKLKRKSVFDGIPNAMPELQRNTKMLQKIIRDGGELSDLEKTELSDGFDGLNKDFTSEALKPFLSKLLITSYQNKIDIQTMIREINRDIQKKYEKN